MKWHDQPEHAWPTWYRVWYRFWFVMWNTNPDLYPVNRWVWITRPLLRKQNGRIDTGGSFILVIWLIVGIILLTLWRVFWAWFVGINW